MLMPAAQYRTSEERLIGLPNKTNFVGKLIVFTSFYDYRGHAPYIHSLVALAMALERLGVRWDYWPVFGDFSINRCINETYTRFLADDDATDILNIDSDESFDPNGVLRLLAHSEEIVGGAYKMKNQWEDWTANWFIDTATGKPIGRVLEDGSALLKAARMPWGFLRIKKSALEKYVAHFPDLYYTSDRGEKVNIFAQEDYRVNGDRGRALFTQDTVLSERMREAGVDLWLDPNITIGHWGNREHRGNLHEHLIALNNAQEKLAQTVQLLDLNERETAAFAEVQKMAREIEERKAA